MTYARAIRRQQLLEELRKKMKKEQRLALELEYQELQHPTTEKGKKNAADS